MSSIKLSPNASGTGIFSIEAPNSSTNRTLTLPDQTGTVLTNAGPFTANASASNGAVTIDASNNVGIGTSSPFGTTANRTVLSINGTNDVLLTLGVGGVRSGTLYHSGTNFGIENDRNGPIYFGTNGSERARIDSSGTLLLNRTSSYAADNKLVVQSNCLSAVMAEFNDTDTTSSNNIIRFRKNGTEAGRIAVTTSNTTQYLTSSDYRLKENVQPMAGALARVAALKPCTYTWKVNGSDGQGFIAHELQAIVPDAVVGEKDAVDADGNIVPQGIDTSFLVATLTAALQELNAKVEAQAAEIAALKGAQA